MTDPEQTTDDAGPTEDLALDDAEAAQVTAGDGTTTDSAYRGRYQLHLGEATGTPPPPATP
jgi:hypothetical protein